MIMNGREECRGQVQPSPDSLFGSKLQNIRSTISKLWKRELLILEGMGLYILQ